MMNRGVMQRQMFRGGGEAVPNQYKGFSKLPENVQQKMNPALAKRYQQGRDCLYDGPCLPCHRVIPWQEDKWTLHKWR
jgi:hypothetical protein